MRMLFEERACPRFGSLFAVAVGMVLVFSLSLIALGYVAVLSIRQSRIAQ